MGISVTGKRCAFVFLAFSPGVAMAWGASGHMLVNRAAIQLMTSKDKQFFQANADNLAEFAKTPDVLWKQKATYEKEKPMHFFQWDRYEASRLESLFPIDLNRATSIMGAPFINENGTTPWRAAQIFKKLKTALAAKDCMTALQMAGVLGHYIGDLSQPMHNSSDYDGQSIHKPGIHKYFESTLVEQQNQASLLAAVIKSGSGSFPEIEQVEFTGQPMQVVDAAVRESKTALEDLAILLADFEESPQDDIDLAKQLAPMMGHGAHVLAKIWDMAAVSAGTSAQDASPHCAARPLKVSEPKWFAIESVNE